MFINVIACPQRRRPSFIPLTVWSFLWILLVLACYGLIRIVPHFASNDVTKCFEFNTIIYKFNTINQIHSDFMTNWGSVIT